MRLPADLQPSMQGALIRCIYFVKVCPRWHSCKPLCLRVFGRWQGHGWVGTLEGGRWRFLPATHDSRISAMLPIKGQSGLRSA